MGEIEGHPQTATIIAPDNAPVQMTL